LTLTEDSSEITTAGTSHAIRCDREYDNKQTRTAPSGYSSVAPWIVSPDTIKLLDFVKRAFGAEELARVPQRRWVDRARRISDW
jgi:hypothetical protein